MRAQRSGRIINVSSIGGKIYGIAAANLAERSAAGPYAPQAAAMAKVLGVYERRAGLLSGPEAVARVIPPAPVTYAAGVVERTRRDGLFCG